MSAQDCGRTRNATGDRLDAKGVMKKYIFRVFR
jgi:hypothetical protein